MKSFYFLFMFAFYHFAIANSVVYRSHKPRGPQLGIFGNTAISHTSTNKERTTTNLGTSVPSGIVSSLLASGTSERASAKTLPATSSIVISASSTASTSPPISVSVKSTPTFSLSTMVPVPTSTPTAGFVQSTQWKVIGVTVIAITVIGVAILSVSFFDQITRFLGDVLCCGRRRHKGAGGFEDLVVDWEKRDWEVQLKGTESRYPRADAMTYEAGRMQGHGHGQSGASEDDDERNPFALRPEPAMVAFGVDDRPSRERYRVEHQPGAENADRPVQLPSQNVFGGAYVT